MYGLLISISLLACIYCAKYLTTKRSLNSELIWPLAFWTIIGGIVGARLYHVVTDWAYYAPNLIKIVYIWNGGLGIFGAILGGSVAAVIYLHTKKEPVIFWLNILGVVAPLGQTIGRWGNFYNNELWGKTLQEMGLSPICNKLPDYGGFLCSLRQPMFLYESILTFLLFGLLFYLYIWRFSGQTFLYYIMGYALIRFILEFVRDTGQANGLINGTQLLCLALATGALLKLFIDIKSTKT